MSDAKKQDIIKYPKEYFELKKRSLDEQLQEIALSKIQEKEIRDKRAIKVFRSDVLGTFPGYSLVDRLLFWNSDLDNNICEAKKELLLSLSLEKCEIISGKVDGIISCISDPVGNTLFNKIIALVNNRPPDQEWIEHLSSVLTKICRTNFRELFEKHSYALGIIENLTPQGLTILKDFERYPPFKTGITQTQGTLIVSNWINDFSSVYGKAKGINSVDVLNRLTHCLNSLVTNNLLEAHNFKKEQMNKVIPTQLGNEIIEYVSFAEKE